MILKIQAEESHFVILVCGEKNATLKLQQHKNNLYICYIFPCNYFRLNRAFTLFKVGIRNELYLWFHIKYDKQNMMVSYFWNF